MGKTSLLARGLQRARAENLRVVLTDMQKITNIQMETSESLFLTLTRDIAEQLELTVSIDNLWNSSWGWNVNFDRFLRREALKSEASHFVWGLDEADRLFGRTYSSDVFGLFRSWHNARSLTPNGPWSQLTLAIAYSTEAHLFITDLNQSPFNVGTRLCLEDFSLGEVAEHNRRYHSPLQNESELSRFREVVGGHPYLVRRGLHAMIEEGLDITQFLEKSKREDGIFGDHLRRMLSDLIQNPSICIALKFALKGLACPSSEAFFRLRSAGVLVGDSKETARLRCLLYQKYLETHLT